MELDNTFRLLVEVKLVSWNLGVTCCFVKVAFHHLQEVGFGVMLDSREASFAEESWHTLSYDIRKHFRQDLININKPGKKGHFANFLSKEELALSLYFLGLSFGGYVRKKLPILLINNNRQKKSLKVGESPLKTPSELVRGLPKYPFRDI